MAYRFGWRPDKPDRRDRYFQYSYWRRFALMLPSAVDLRPDMPPVYDQGNLGSCTGNAICGAVQHGHIDKKLPAFLPSRLFVYYNERLIEGTVGEDAGAEIRDGIKSLTKWGVCPESDWPYDIDRFAEMPTQQAYANAKRDIIERYQRTYQTADYLKAALSIKKPVVFGFTVYESFENLKVDHTGNVPMPGAKENVIGGHAVLACGYTDKRVRFRNSYGKSWGDHGYGTLPWEYVLNNDMSADFWVIDVK